MVMYRMYKSLSNVYIIGFVLVCVIYFTTAYNSHGFYHADEHYQIIEFAGLKSGTHSAEELAWEFKAQIRPMLQPSICFIVFNVLDTIKIRDPYTQAFVLRMLSAILALIIISSFIKQTINSIADINAKRAYCLLSFCMWFIPFISVRFSSETWSGLLFLLSLTIYLNPEHPKLRPYLLGIVLGLSFLFRFQIAFAFIGFFLWILFFDRKPLPFWIKTGMLFLCILFMGFLIDAWYYGEWVFSPWNYFHVNIINNAASDFGTSPWYYYIVKFIRFPGYPIGILLLISFIILTLLKPSNPFIWCLFFFVLFHSFIAHKEERFIFPLVYLFPMMMVSAYQELSLFVKNRFAFLLLNYILVSLLIFSNSIGLLAMGYKSAGIGRMEITRYIHKESKSDRINLIYCSWANPYNPWHSLPMKFYHEQCMKEKRINSLCELNDSMLIPHAKNFLIIRKADLGNPQCNTCLTSNHFIFVKQSIPPWIEQLSKIYGDFDCQNILELYEYGKQ